MSSSLALCPATPCTRLSHVLRGVSLAAALSLLASASVQAFGQRESSALGGSPRVDASDFYFFSSYEAGRGDFVTLIANYQAGQDPAGGPLPYLLDPNALYEIHVDNTGDGREDISFQFRFRHSMKGLTLPVGGKAIALPGVPAGVVNLPLSPALNLNESFTLEVVRGDRRSGVRSPVLTAAGSTHFDKPVDNLGPKATPDYAAYAARHVHTVQIPGCSQPAKVFVGQRRESAAANPSALFDFANLPLAELTDASRSAALANPLAERNVTSLALELHKSCLVAGNEPVLGAWTTASLRQSQLHNPAPKPGIQGTAVVGGAWVQASRLGMPLVNTLLVGLPDKDRFNASKPKDDAQFADYISHPSWPALLEAALSTTGLAPTNLPRADLNGLFFTGLAGLNQPRNGVPADLLRLNTAVPPLPLAQQNRLGVLGELARVGGSNPLANAADLAGFPNGRRPKDDVVDITLMAALGSLCLSNGDADALKLGAACKPAAVPLGLAAHRVNDAVDTAATGWLPGFPYLPTPLAGKR